MTVTVLVLAKGGFPESVITTGTKCFLECSLSNVFNEYRNADPLPLSPSGN